MQVQSDTQSLEHQLHVEHERSERLTEERNSLVLQLEAEKRTRSQLESDIKYLRESIHFDDCDKVTELRHRR
jgi:hypothetical protein